MEDILDLYERPYDPDFPVVCIDEKLKPLLKEKRAQILPSPGHPAREDYEYDQTGSRNIFIHFEPLSGSCHVSVTERRTAKDWAEDMRHLADQEYPNAKRIIVVQDNLNTHKAASFYQAFEPAEARRLTQRFEFHNTPKHGSWLNMAEIGLSVLEKQCLCRRLGDGQVIEREVRAWEESHDHRLKVIDWRFRTADARIKLKRLYPTIEA